MNKYQYFLKAIQSKAFENNHWMFSCFSIIQENTQDWMQDPYPYRVVSTPIGYYFVDPEKKSELTQITDCQPGIPLFTFKEKIELKSGFIQNLKEDIVTTIGNILFNCMCLINAFGDKIAFINKKIQIDEVEKEIASRLKDTPEQPDQRNNKHIYVDEYIIFVDSLFHLTNFSQLCVWGATEKVISPPPGIKEFKQKLLEKYKDSLNSSVTLAKIDRELVEYDANYLKDDPGMNFLLSTKSRSIVRKKKYLIYGAEQGLEDSVTLDPITNSLDEGWDIKKFPQMNNALRAGSFNRGAQTELGGESVKWLLRASSNIVITTQDCGSTIGKPFTVDKNNHRKLIDFTILIDGDKKLISPEDDTAQYIGKNLMVRSPMYCKLSMTDFCETCVGVKLSRNPTGLSMVISEYGSSFLGIFMSAAHAKQLALQKADLKTLIS